jgi:opacity protein-like surface antigen
MPVPHANLARLFGTDIARSYLISDAILAGFEWNASVASRPTYASMGNGWHAWVTPRQVNFTDHVLNVPSRGSISDLTYGLGYRFGPDLIAGFAINPEYTRVSFDGVNASLQQSGIGGGPYVGWRIRPTTVFDAWLGYVRLDRTFDVVGHEATMPVDRTFVSASLTEVVDTPWMRVLPRLTAFHAQDRVGTVTTGRGFIIPGQTYSWGHVEGSVEFNRDFMLGEQLRVQPFVRATMRYDTEQLVPTVTRLDDTEVELPRWHGQLHGGVRAQYGRQTELWLSGGYLSFFTPGVQAWEAKAHFRMRFDEATSAFAADLPLKAPPRVVYDWTGCSFGVTAGYGRSIAKLQSAPNEDIAAFARNNGATAAIAAQQAASVSSQRDDGIVAGGGVSCNVQFGKTVVGLETDISYTGFQSSTQRGPFAIAGPVAATWENSFRSNYLGTVRGRLGLVANAWSLLYVTGGLAYADLAYAAATDFPGFTGFRFEGAASRLKLGWTAGVGLEAALSGPWSAKMEYLYVDLGDRTVIGPQNAAASPFAWEHSARVSEHIVRVGLNYRFTGLSGGRDGWLSR